MSAILWGGVTGVGVGRLPLPALKRNQPRPTGSVKPHLIGHRMKAHMRVSLLHSMTLVRPTMPRTWTSVM